MRGSTRRRLVWAGIGLVAGIVIWKAWVADDAAITFRVVDNVVAGRGLVWNPGERVQVFTHPSWMLLLAVAKLFTGELYFTSLALSLACTVAAASVLAFRAASSWETGILGLALLATSRAFTDFSTSGLENALAHLLLALMLVARTPLAVSLLAGLCLLTRLDLAALVALPWLAVLWNARDRPARAIAAAASGLAPVATWSAFALVYYGSPIPNTALAKLNTGISAGELTAQGLRYLENSLLADPLTLITIAIAAIASLILRRASGSDNAAALSAPAWVWAIGILLSLGYTVRVGGDFMSGRFLTPELFVAIALLVSRPLGPRLALGGVTAAGALLLVPWSSPFFERDYGPDWSGAIDRHGIADERAFYGQFTHLWSPWARSEKWPHPRAFEEARWLNRNWPQDWFADDLIHVGTIPPTEQWPPAGMLASDGTPYRRVVVRGEAGFLAYHLGPEVHMIDYHAIGDPLLARLPMTRPDPIAAILLPQLERDWRVGHYYRALPPGYVQTVATGQTVFDDPELGRFYDVLQTITRAPLLDPERLATIWRLQRGEYDDLLTAQWER